MTDTDVKKWYVVRAVSGQENKIKNCFFNWRENLPSHGKELSLKKKIKVLFRQLYPRSKKKKSLSNSRMRRIFPRNKLHHQIKKAGIGFLEQKTKKIRTKKMLLKRILKKTRSLKISS